MRVEEIILEVTELCRKHAAKQVILFGSRAKGIARERSDIDIAVSGAEDFDGLVDVYIDKFYLLRDTVEHLKLSGSDLTQL